MLVLSDREEISRGLAEGLQYKEIGLRMGRHASVISRDVARHGGRAGYRVAAAELRACAARGRPKLFAVERSCRLRAVVCRQLRGGWFPASIAGRLPADYPDDQACRVSHEAIYQWGVRATGVDPGQGTDQPADRAQYPGRRAPPTCCAADPRAPLHR
ncbi:MAG: helix-turn-helix domain-containing protein [Actinobacteria bacterium]|nr:helix-turn-helix domain-containing protein [Actinomycetota bacterium]